MGGVKKPLVVVDTIRISTIGTFKKTFFKINGWWVKIKGNAKKPDSCNGPRGYGCPEPRSHCSKCEGSGSDGSNEESECTIHLRTQKHWASKTRANEFENTLRKALNGKSRWNWTKAKLPCVGLPDRPSALDGKKFLYQKKNAQHIQFWKECFKKDPQVDPIDSNT